MSQDVETQSILSHPKKALDLALQPPESAKVDATISELFDLKILETGKKGENGEENGEEEERKWDGGEEIDDEELENAIVTPFGKLCHNVTLSFEACKMIIFGGLAGTFFLFER